MVLFPDEFPFVRKPEAPSQEAVEPAPAVPPAGRSIPATPGGPDGKWGPYVGRRPWALPRVPLTPWPRGVFPRWAAPSAPPCCPPPAPPLPLRRMPSLHSLQKFLTLE